MLMLASVSFSDVVWILLIGILGVASFVYTTLQAERLLGEWAAKEGCELIESKRSFLETGPFMPGSKGVVYRVKVRYPEGKIRSGWARCGGYLSGPMFDNTYVIWD
jgi:hypothetical protein